MKAKPGQIVDHINNDDATVKNNTIENLRISDASGNGHNKTKNLNATSQHSGVSYNKAKSKWTATITKDKRRYNLGDYDEEKDAAIAYNAKATELYGEFANLNVIK